MLKIYIRGLYAADICKIDLRRQTLSHNKRGNARVGLFMLLYRKLQAHIIRRNSSSASSNRIVLPIQPNNARKNLTNNETKKNVILDKEHFNAEY